MKVTVEATDHGRGFTLYELEQAIAQARNAGCTRLGKVRMSMGGKLRAVEFEADMTDVAAGPLG
jgi:ribosomal protein L13E